MREDDLGSTPGSAVGLLSEEFTFVRFQGSVCKMDLTGLALSLPVGETIWSKVSRHSETLWGREAASMPSKLLQYISLPTRATSTSCLSFESSCMGYAGRGKSYQGAMFWSWLSCAVEGEYLPP